MLRKVSAAALVAASHRRLTIHRLIKSPPLFTTPNASAFSPRSSSSSSSLNISPFQETRKFGNKSDLTEPEIEEEQEDESDDGWEEEEEHEVESEIGDGGNGGGVVLRGVAWGERVLSIAQEVLLGYGDDIVLFAFKVNPKGYIYVRIDNTNEKYGCPSTEVMEDFVNCYNARLDEVGERGEIPNDLAVEVSSPGAERLLKVPDDLHRFKDLPMWVYFFEDNPESEHQQESEKVLLLDSFDTESQKCVWKLANVRENRDVGGKGRPLSRKHKDWRLTLSFDSIRKIKLYLDFKTK